MLRHAPPRVRATRTSSCLCSLFWRKSLLWRFLVLTFAAHHPAIAAAVLAGLEALPVPPQVRFARRSSRAAAERHRERVRASIAIERIFDFDIL